jgi:hypothetical protein
MIKTFYHIAKIKYWDKLSEQQIIDLLKD